MKGIKLKILLPSYILAFVFIAMMGLQLWLVGTNRIQVKNMNDVYFETVSLADELKLNIVQVQQWLTDISATRGAEGYDDGFTEADAHAKEIDRIISELKSLNPTQTTSLDAILTSFKPYYETGKRMAQAYIDNGPTGGNEIMGEFDSVAETINYNVDKFTQTANNNIKESIATVEYSIEQSTTLGLVSLVLAIVICIIANYSVTKRVIKPIKELDVAADALANGNLSTTINYTSNDEIGAFANSLRLTISTLNQYITEIGKCLYEMGNRNLQIELTDDFKGDFNDLRESVVNCKNAMKSTLHEISQSAAQVADGSEQVSNGSQLLATGANEQARSIEELSNIVNDLALRVRTNANTAEQANKLAENVGAEAEESNHHMHEMINAMNNISESSNQIGKIIKAIEDIAFQTNILALNAAVEAARAGVAGKGFAVVADEVRSLASKSAEAANNTSALINQSIQTVQSGTQIADRTAAALSAVSTGITNVVQTIGEISSASNDQANSIEEVTKGIAQISNVVQTISSTAEESGCASQELSGQANNLNELVAQFKL